MAMRFIADENRIVLGDEDEGGIVFPVLQLEAEISLHLFRFTLTEPCGEKKFHTADDDERLCRARRDEREKIIRRKCSQPVAEAGVGLECVEHIEMRRTDGRGELRRARVLLAEIGCQKHRGLVAPDGQLAAELF